MQRISWASCAENTKKKTVKTVVVVVVGFVVAVVATLNRPLFCGVGALPLTLWTAPHDNLDTAYGIYIPP